VDNKPAHNSDGLIKCLPPAQDKFVTSSSIYARKLCNIYKVLWHPDSFISRDSIVGLVGRRSGALFFARHRDYFIVTRNFTAIYLDLVLSRSFTVTRYSQPSNGTGKKQCTATQTATNQTAEPLGGIARKTVACLL
jgi:hypothetical protein